MSTRNTSGIVHLLPLFAVFAVAIVGVFFIRNPKGLIRNLTATPAPTVSPQGTSLVQTPTASPAPTPTLTPTSRPTLTANPSQTPIPTHKPIPGPPGTGYSSVTVHTEKGDFSVRVLSLDLTSTRVITDTASDNDCGDNCPVLSLQDFISRNGGFAGVNGTYFCPETYSECSGKKNSFDFPVYNSRLNKWINGGNLFWNGRSMIYFDGGGAHYKQSANSFSGGLSAGIVNHPGLLDSGNVQIDNNQSGLSEKQKAKGTKVGIGLRGTNNVMVVVANNVNMQEFAYVFKALSADSALNLDTGGSTALYFGGRYLAGPGRNLPNTVIFASK